MGSVHSPQEFRMKYSNQAVFCQIVGPVKLKLYMIKYFDNYFEGSGFMGEGGTTLTQHLERFRFFQSINIFFKQTFSSSLSEHRPWLRSLFTSLHGSNAYCICLVIFLHFQIFSPEIGYDFLWNIYHQIADESRVDTEWSASLHNKCNFIMTVYVQFHCILSLGNLDKFHSLYF